MLRFSVRGLFTVLFVVGATQFSPAGTSYRPPSGYEDAVKGIEFSKAENVSEDYRVQFKKCDEQNVFRGENMKGYRRCYNDKYKDPNNLNGLIKFPSGAIMFDAKMAVDVDGGYNPCAGTPGKTDLCPTTYVFDQARGWSEAKRKKNWRKAYANSDTLPYVVIPWASGGYDADPKEFSKLTGITMGDVGVIVYRDKVVPVLVGDGGPHNKIGEGSLAAFDAIGVTRCGKRHSAHPDYCTEVLNYSLSKPVLYFLFPNSSVKDATPANIYEIVSAKAMTLFEELKAD